MSFFHCYKKHRFGPDRTLIIDRANQIVEDYERQGYVLTLRQLYYRFIAKDWFPDSWINRPRNIKAGLEPNTKNTEWNYDRLGEIVARAREAGRISWTGIEDRGRAVYGTSTEEDPNQVLNGIENALVYDLWKNQDTYVELWVEKQALESVVARPCNDFRINFMATKGYISLSESWRAGLRFQKAYDAGKDCVLLHLGDHDPSGIDMTRANDAVLSMFLPESVFENAAGDEVVESGVVKVKRLALNMDQVKKYDPPPNPAKMSDSRAGDYVNRFGRYGWELDALEPKQLDTLIRKAIRKFIDKKVWERDLATEAEERKTLKLLHEDWPRIEKGLKKKLARLAKKGKAK